MISVRRMLVVAALCACLAPNALAQKESEAPLLPDAAHQAVGAWVGGVSWNDAIVQYGWSIFPDGAFTSGRLGRGENGGGEWSTHGAHLTLKYANGLRYEGDLKDDEYSGEVYTTDGRLIGSFHMARDIKNFDVPEEGG